MISSNENISFNDVQQFIVRNFKFLSILFLSVFIGTYLVTRFLITPKYQSECIIYPANINPVSSEDPTEQAVQVLNSADIKWAIIDSFDLLQHYGLSNNKFSMHDLSKTYDNHVSVERTPYSSISIIVLDKDKNMAATIANEIVEQLNLKMQSLKNEKYREWASFAKKKYEDKLKGISSLENVLNKTKKENNILSFDEQAASLALKVNNLTDNLLFLEAKISYLNSAKPKYYRDSIKIAEIKIEGYKSREYNLKEKFNQLIAVGDKLKGLEQKLDLEREALIELKNEYEEAEQNANRKLTYSYVISKAEASEKPATPKRLLSSIVISSSALALALLLLIFIEKNKRSKNNN